MRESTEMPVIAGSARWSWRCPICGAGVTARRAVAEELHDIETMGSLVEFEHAQPICDEFEDGEEVLEKIVDAWKKGVFVTTDAGSGPS